MEVAMVGLGRMGGNMARRLLRGGHRVVVWNRTYAKAEELGAEGAEPVEELTDVVKALSAPRAIWIMLPYGDATQAAIDELTPLLDEGDILIDGGNSPFQHDIERGAQLQPKGIRYLDAGTSGGVWGLEVGYCLMVGGDESAFEHVEPLLETLAPPGTATSTAAAHGSGHFVKMVHNGIEYGMMQAYAEGFELLRGDGVRTSTWPRSPISGTRAAWCAPGCSSSPADALKKDPDLEQITGYVEDTGEGRWTVEQAIATACPMPAISRRVVHALPFAPGRTPSPARCSPPCATSSAATPSRRRSDGGRSGRRAPQRTTSRTTATRSASTSPARRKPPGRPRRSVASGTRTLQPRHLRRHRRPRPPQADPGAVRPGLPRRAAVRHSRWSATAASR